MITFAIALDITDSKVNKSKEVPRKKTQKHICIIMFEKKPQAIDFQKIFNHSNIIQKLKRERKYPFRNI